MTRARAFACLCAAVAAVVSACTGDARRADLPAVPTVRIGTFVQSNVNWLAGLFSAEPLVSVGWDGRPSARLAESVTESDDGMALKVRLRPDVRFHDGSPVTAPVVCELLMKKLRTQPHVDIRAFEPENARDLVVRLNRAYSVKAVDLDYGIEDDTRPQLRTGPFKLVSFGPPAILEPNKDYQKGPPDIGRVEVNVFPNHRVAWTAMMRGEINFLHEVNREALNFVEEGGDIRAYPLLRPFTIAIVFNQRHPILQRREVRVALNEAVNRDEVVDNGMRRYGQVADGPFWPHHWAYPSGVHAQAHNPKAAALRLDAANLPVMPRGNSAMPSRFSFTCLLVAGADARFERIALVIQRQLAALGIDMQLRLVQNHRTFLQTLVRGEYDAFLYEIASGRTLRFPYRFWHSKAPVVPTGYSAADEALDRMVLARTDEEARAAVSDVMRVFRQDPPAVFLAFPRESRAADASFEIPYETDRDVFGNLRLLKLAARPARRDR